MTTFAVAGRSGLARAGVLGTPHGVIETPVFMPVGTQAAVKGIDPLELRRCGATIVLANAYHCYLRPGAAAIAGAGGLHRFMAWDGGILTDSGGFQIFSLARLSHVDDDGYHFASHVDGSRHTFTPESVTALQEQLGSDIAMVLDDVAPAGVDRSRAKEAADRTARWAERSLRAKKSDGQTTFAIVQGSTFEDIRRSNARSLIALGFPGYAIGGLWLGEAKAHGIAMTRVSCEELPEGKPRYLMGVGTPEDVLAGIAVGVDMFDCVYPTRCARHALALTRSGKLNLRNARFVDDYAPLDDGCGCAACSQFSRAYLSHCFRAGEFLGPRMVSAHNLWFMSALSRDARAAIMQGCYGEWMDDVVRRLRADRATTAAQD